MSLETVVDCRLFCPNKLLTSSCDASTLLLLVVVVVLKPLPPNPTRESRGDVITGGSGCDCCGGIIVEDVGGAGVGADKSNPPNRSKRS